MRTKNSFLNFMANTGSHLLNILLSFVCRTVFIYTLSVEYLGINGLFGNVLTVLSFAELGIGTAMIEYLCELAAKVGWQQLDLEVVAENEQAIALYKKCGFLETGRRHNALLIDDGSLHDEILMYKKL